MDGLRKDISTGIFVATNHFNATKVIKTEKEQQYNVILTNVVRDFECIINTKAMNKQSYNVPTIMNDYKQRDKRYITLSKWFSVKAEPFLFSILQHS